MTWRHLQVSPCGTHHIDERGQPGYAEHFDEVLKFHSPGLAPVLRGGRAWHILSDGAAAYAQRFARTFGYYEGLAAVIASTGWHHIKTDGCEAYAARYAWCGNFQSGRCAVRDQEGAYFHITPQGERAYPARWRYAGDYRDGIAVAQAEDGRSTHIQLDGSRLHQQWFLDLDVFHKGFARAKDNFGWTHVNTRGEPIYRRRFAMVEPFYNGQARVEGFDGALEVIDERGTTLATLRSPPHAQPLLGPVLARSPWGRVHLEGDRSSPHVVKWTRGCNEREVEVLRTLQDVPGVPRLLGRQRHDMNDQLYLEHRTGEVVGRPRSLRVWGEPAALHITCGVLRVLSAMHTLGWVHTDCHPGNVMVSQSGLGEVTLLDYACAVRASYRAPWRGEINWGVWEYAPPEQLADRAEITPAADVYSAACLCIAMTIGAPAIRIDTRRVLHEGSWDNVREGIRAQGPHRALAQLSARAQEALRPALASQPSARPTASQLLEALSDV